MKRKALIIAVLAALLPLLLCFAPIQQASGYHDLADQRALLGIPHFWNVVSNLPFLVIGLMGLQLLRRRPPQAMAGWATLFAGTALASFGSVYYHLDPNDATLVWDRIPIGIAFMGFFAALLAEDVESRAQAVLVPLVAFAIGTIYWWRATGDLAAWIWVQLAPMLAIVLVLALLPGRHSHRRYLAYALAWYVGAKLFELGDEPILRWTAGVMSGHALKHFAAAAGVWCFYVMLRDRQRL